MGRQSRCTLLLLLVVVLEAALGTATASLDTTLDDYDASEECGTPADPLCVRSCVFIKNHNFDHGFAGDIHLHFDAVVDSWTADVQFDHELASFTTWNCPVTTSDHRVFSLTNNQWDGHHNANTTITISFNAYYEGGQQPVMQSVKLNGQERCVSP